MQTREGMVLSISDSGKGMTEDICQKIFDPFFTTKAIGQGMGLGLTLVHTIINSYNWMIDVKSAPGRTKFSISIPTHAIKLI